MLTIAQMFPLDTYAALPFFSWMWSYFPPQLSSPPGAHQLPLHPRVGVVILQVGRTLLCWGVRLHLIPSCILEKLLEQEMLRRAQAKCHGERWECSICSRWPPRSCGSQRVYDPNLTKSFQRKISLDWLSRGRTNYWGSCDGVNHGPLFLGPESVLLAWRLPLKQAGLCRRPPNGLLSTWCILWRNRTDLKCLLTNLMRRYHETFYMCFHK